LEAITIDARQSVAELPLLNELENYQVLEKWNATEVSYPMGKCLHEHFEDQQTTVTIKGDLNVIGTTTTINSTTLEVGDNFIILNSGVTGAPTIDAGMIVERGTSTDAVLKWSEGSDEWVAGLLGSEAPVLTILTSPVNGRFYSGTVDPTDTTRLNYNGYFYATRVYNAVYNDIAEFMPKAEDCHATIGYVMVQTENGLMPSYQRADKRAVGVFSDTFGYALGASNMDKKVPIALIGRVKVWVAEPVEIGDYLVSAENGFAAKATAEEMKDPTVIIGKALQNKKDSNPELIEILVK